MKVAYGLINTLKKGDSKHRPFTFPIPTLGSTPFGIKEKLEFLNRVHYTLDGEIIKPLQPTVTH